MSTGGIETSSQRALSPDVARFLSGFEQAFDDRFSLESVRQCAGGVLTATGHDIETRQPVFIRAGTDPRISAGLRMRLAYDARALQGVDGDEFSRILGAAIVAQNVFLVSELVVGPSLAEILANTSRLPVVDALTLGRRLFAALARYHSRGVRHRNVNPRNIIVGEPGKWSTAKLVNFGATREWTPDLLVSDQVLAEIRYVSPEQAGTIDQDLGAPADLYSAGAVLFACLTGQSPFCGTTVSDILLSHLTAPIPRLRETGCDAPRVVDELLARLMRKDPRDRYQTAQAVVDDLDQILELMHHGVAEPAMVIGGRDERGTLTEPAFVGRDTEVRSLQQRLSATLRGAGGLAYLEGESGSGKSRLLVEVGQMAVGRGFRVFRGRGSSEVGQMPFAMLDQVADYFAQCAATDQQLVERVREALGDDCATLVAALPRLQAVLGSVHNQIAPEAFIEARTLRVLRSFLLALGDHERPALIVLDDCQWADELTLKLLSSWQNDSAQRQGRDNHVLVLASFRTEEVGAEHLLRRTTPGLHCRLTGLSDDDVVLLAQSMGGQLPSEAMEHVVRVAAGSPFMASATLRGLVEVQALIPGERGWEVNPLAMAECRASTEAAELLTRRVRLLSPETRDLLTIGAVLGREFSLELVSQLVGQSDTAVITALDEARQRHLIWLRPDESTCVFMHDKIREVLLDHLTADERQGVHRRAANYLATLPSVNSLDLAFHFDSAGDHEQALPYALEAAEQARSQHSLEIAKQQFLIAERGATSAGRSTQFRVAEGLGDVLMLRGEYDAAARQLEVAGQLARGNYAQAQIRGKLAELAFKRGMPVQAATDYETALRLLGTFVPYRSAGFLLLLMKEAVVQVLHTLFPTALVHRLRRYPNEREALTLRLFSGLAHSYWYGRSKFMVLWAHLRGLNLGERYLATPELAQAYSEHAPAMTLVAFFNRAFRYAKKSLEIRRNLGDLWGQGAALNYYGITLYAASRYEECVSCCRESIRLLERMGDYWLMHMARYQLAASLYRLGELDEAILEAKTNYRSALDVSDEQASRIILDVWSRAGSVPANVLAQETARQPGDSQGTGQLLLAEGVWYLKQDQTAQAIRVLDEAVRVTREAEICNAYTIPCLAWLATAHRLAATERTYDAAARRRHLQLARRAVQSGLRATAISKNDLPHLLREKSLVAALEGRRSAAVKAMRKSLQWAERLRAADEQLQNIEAIEALGLTELAAWQDRLASNGRAPSQNHITFSSVARQASKDTTLSLVDRFQTVLVSGRRIASALLIGEIYEEARQAASRMLRGDNCLIVEVGPDDQLSVAAGDPSSFDPNVDAALIRGCLERGGAVSGPRQTGFGGQIGAATSSRGSALCAPIHVRDRLVACLYVTHGSIESLFGEAEERLAEFIAVITGAACENAQGFAELRQLNATLEDRVAERTAAAQARAEELEVSNRNLERVASDLRETEEELRIAMHRAEQANEAKGRFLATMSHEIRTPMNGVLGMTEIALRTPLTIQQKGYLNLIKQSGVALLTLLNDILDFSKIEAGRMDLEQVAIDLHDTVQNSARLLSTSAYQKGLELVCMLRPDAPRRVIGDPTRLRQVIVNLVGNAVKFTEKGQVVVTVEPWFPEGGRPGIHLSVRDTGIGIPESQQKLIFDPFRQSDSSTTRRFGGTGLGLSISRQLVEMMGGRMWLESQVGVGTTFHCEIPLEIIPDSTGPADAPLAHRSVLVISDHSEGRAAYAAALQHLGAEVLTTSSQDPLVQIDGHVGAVIVDRSGAIDINRVIGRVRQKLPGRPIIGLYPPGEEMLGHDIVEAQITKPPTSDELLDIISRLHKTASRQARSDDKSGNSDDTPSVQLQVLLVDDSEVNLIVGRGLLELRGHIVDVATNGGEAIASCRRGSYDVVLMDLEMPDMDGFAATRQIREIPGYDQVPIYAMTAHVSSEVQGRLADAAMNGFLPKPVDPAHLFATIERPRSK
ncbi:MAG: ATP-binding protein [Pirellulales bacterium]